MPHRRITAVVAARRDDIGDLVTWRPHPAPAETNPFLFINHHGPQVYPPNNGGLPFGPHPHRGFETVTVILQGDLVHRDSAGFESLIRAGGVQWMTAGSGLFHNETVSADFLRNGGTTEMLQMWVNLPSDLKMTPPAYQGAQAEELETIRREADGATINLVAGQLDKRSGPITSLTGIVLATISLTAGSATLLSAPAGRELFLYVIDGSVDVEGEVVGPRSQIRFDRAGDTVAIGSQAGATLLFAHADPIGEPIVMSGPFVMNTSEQINAAINDVRSGRLGAGSLLK